MDNHLLCLYHIVYVYCSVYMCAPEHHCELMCYINNFFIIIIIIIIIIIRDNHRSSSPIITDHHRLSSPIISNDHHQSSLPIMTDHHRSSSTIITRHHILSPIIITDHNHRSSLSTRRSKIIICSFPNDYIHQAYEGGASTCLPTHSLLCTYLVCSIMLD